MAVWEPLNLTEVCPSSTPIAQCSSFGFVYLNLLVQLFGNPPDMKKQEICEKENKLEHEDGKEYDFIIVGAGAAGCVGANRLTANPQWKVLMLEAGPEEPYVTRVPGMSTALLGSNIDWQYSTEPNGKSCLAWGGRCAWPRGKTLGGSSAINSMGYVRGHRVDYDRWALMGNKGWSYKDVLPFFKKSECNMNKYAVDSDYHGARGEQMVSWFPYVDDPANMMVEAYTERGVPFSDFNGAEQEGTMQIQGAQHEGERVSAYDAFIRDIRYKRPNLIIKTNSEATKILVDKNKNAYGVIYMNNGKKYTAYAKKEVIVSAGAIATPKLLMLSGIGPKEHLESLKIPVIKDLAVGENVQDHVAFSGVIVGLKQTSTAISQEEVLSSVKEYAKMKVKNGPLSGNGPVMSCAFIKTEENLIAPDIQYQANCITNLTHYLEDPVTMEAITTLPTSYYDALIPRAMNLVPKSRGRILLNKTNPYGQPLIHVNYLGDDRDLIPLLKGVRFLLSLEDTEAFKSRGAYYVREKMPHCKQYEWGTDEYFVCLMRQYTTTTHHHSGSCKMGPKWDKKAVVDNQLRVYGIKWLRVIDASIMPVLVRGNTLAPSLMIGERGYDFVIKYWQERTKNYCF